MKIPHRVRITSRVSYDVVWVSAFTDKTIVGETDPNKKQIRLKLGEPNSEISLTWIHELLHCLSFEHELDLTERQVAGLERAIKRFMKLNPKVLK